MNIITYLFVKINGQQNGWEILICDNYFEFIILLPRYKEKPNNKVEWDPFSALLDKY